MTISLRFTFTMALSPFTFIPSLRHSDINQLSTAGAFMYGNFVPGNNPFAPSANIATGFNLASSKQWGIGAQLGFSGFTLGVCRPECETCAQNCAPRDRAAATQDFSAAIASGGCIPSIATLPGRSKCRRSI